MFGSFYRLIPIKTIENLSKYDHNVTPVVAEGVASAGQFTIRTCQMERKKKTLHVQCVRGAGGLTRTLFL
jgi:hypothetical protein